MGRASAESYTHVLGRNGCCIEIDVWPSSKGPVVTHGYTLSTSVPFESVCVAIGDAINEDHWPVLVSLECHVPEEGQDQLVDIMKGAWGDKLVDTEIPYLAGDHNLTPKDIMGRILLMVSNWSPSSPRKPNSSDHVICQVEYYPPKAEGVGLSSDEFSDDSAVEEAESEQGTFPRKHAHGKISPSLAALGYYARSMKPDKNWLTERQFYYDPFCNPLVNLIKIRIIHPTLPSAYPNQYFRAVPPRTDPRTSLRPYLTCTNKLAQNIP